jgi:hypothetical protein
VFVVEGVVSEAAVQDADEPVGEGSEGLVVVVASTAVGVEVAGSGAGGEGGEGPEVERVGEPAIAGVAGQDDVAASA